MGAQATAGPWVANSQHSGENPWRVETDAPGYENDGWIIATFEGPDAEANARLTAAAPDMLAALKLLCDADATYVSNKIHIDCDSHGDAIARMRIARAAIAKATPSPETGEPT